MVNIMLTKYFYYEININAAGKYVIFFSSIDISLKDQLGSARFESGTSYQCATSPSLLVSLKVYTQGVERTPDQA